MVNILSFDLDRELFFSADRELGFDPDKGLTFNPDREWTFNPRRDLPFGKRGVVFRGYICPECGATVLREQERCAECGVRFSRKPSAKAKTKKSVPPMRKRGAPRRNVRQDALAYCLYCGVRLRRGDAYCWNCGGGLQAETTAAQSESTKGPAAEKIRLPPKRVGKKVTKDWSEAGYRMPEE